MRASDVFKVGQRVKLTKDGLEHFRDARSFREVAPYTADLRGTVLGTSEECVHVQRDGVPRAESYAARFWEAA